MRRTASEAIHTLENRIANLEKRAARVQVSGRLILETENPDGGFTKDVKGVVGIREIQAAIATYKLTEASLSLHGDKIVLFPHDRGESQGYWDVTLEVSQRELVREFLSRLGLFVVR